MNFDDRTLEKKLLVKRIFSVTAIFQIGKEQAIPFFDQYVNAWEPDPDEASMEIAQAFSDQQLQEVLRKHASRTYAVFRGAHYTFEEGTLTLKGSHEKILAGIAETQKKFGKTTETVLKLMVQSGGVFGAKELKETDKLKTDVYAVLERLEQLKVVVPSYVGDGYNEWRLPEETLSLIRDELGIDASQAKLAPALSQSSAASTTSSNAAPATPTFAQEEGPPDPLEDERRKVMEMQTDLDRYLSDLLKNRLSQTIAFGKTFSANSVAE